MTQANVAAPEVTEDAKAKAAELIAKLSKLNTAQRLAMSLGIPYEIRKHANGGPCNSGHMKSKHNHVSTRSAADRARKKKLHAKRVGRPK